MAQDDPQVQGSRESDPQAPVESDARRWGVWPWVALVIVALIAAYLLWLFWSQQKQSSTRIPDKSTQTSVVLPQERPEPVVPQPSGGTTRAPVAELVPDVLGDLKSSAVRTLESAGYRVTSSVSQTTSKASGIVIGQRPAGGAELAPGETVSIVVSASKQTAGNVKMPSVVGLSQAEAVKKVEAAGLSPVLTYGRSGIPDGDVISQWPLAGEVVPSGRQALIQIQLTP